MATDGEPLVLAISDPAGKDRLDFDYTPGVKVTAPDASQAVDIKELSKQTG